MENSEYVVLSRKSYDERKIIKILPGLRRTNGGKLMDWYEKTVRNLGYKGCRNCKHQIDVLRACEWLEHGGDGVVHLICPKWEKRTQDGETESRDWRTTV